VKIQGAKIIKKGNDIGVDLVNNRFRSRYRVSRNGARHQGKGGKDGRQKVGAVFGMPFNAAHLSQEHFSASTIPP